MNQILSRCRRGRWAAAAAAIRTHSSTAVRSGGCRPPFRGETSVWSFGDNSQGALGLPSPPYEAFEPTRVPSLPPDVSSVAAGHYHSLAVTSSGEVWAWGRNDEGQLGRDLSAPRQSWCIPQKVQDLAQVRVRAAFASGVVSAAIGDDGSLWVWGKSKRGQLGLGKGVIEAVRPSKVEAFAGKEIVKVAFGWGHALAQTSGGELFGWGYSAEGRLGQMGKSLETQWSSNADVSETTRTISSVIEIVEKEVLEELEKERNMPIIWEPSVLQELSSVKVSDVVCGLDHTLVLGCDGRLLSCGNNIYGQLGRSTDGSHMLPVEMHFRPLSLSAGLGHSLAVCQGSSEETSVGPTKLATWGWNWGSELGRQGQEHHPAYVEGLSGEELVSASGGRAHSIALTAEGEVWTWGSGRNGRLGLGSSADETEPTMVECLEGFEVLQAVSGFDHNLLLVAE